MRFIITLSLSILAATAVAHHHNYEILISKKNNTLTVQQAGQVIKQYYSASGKGGSGTKRIRGDDKTPIGIYRVAYLKPSERFHYFIHLDYPNLIDAWHGYKNKIIDAGDFKRITNAYKYGKIPPQDTKLGGFIGIHGIGRVNQKKLDIHETFNWTNGCIALTNQEIDELRQFIRIGTKVIIKE